MKAAVELALSELEADGPGKGVQFREDADGGAYVLVEEVAIGERFQPGHSWIAFHITHSYPEAAVYPHFVDATLRYVGEGETPNQHADGDLPLAMSRGEFLAPGFELPAIQISRSSPHRDPSFDTALKKLWRVIAFLESR